MKLKYKFYLLYCVIELLLKFGKYYYESQTLNSFDGELSYIYSGFSLEIEDALTMYL